MERLKYNQLQSILFTLNCRNFPGLSPRPDGLLPQKRFHFSQMNGEEKSVGDRKLPRDLLPTFCCHEQTQTPPRHNYNSQRHIKGSGDARGAVALWTAVFWGPIIGGLRCMVKPNNAIKQLVLVSLWAACSRFVRGPHFGTASRPAPASMRPWQYNTFTRIYHKIGLHLCSCTRKWLAKAVTDKRRVSQAAETGTRIKFGHVTPVSVRNSNTLSGDSSFPRPPGNEVVFRDFSETGKTTGW